MTFQVQSWQKRTYICLIQVYGVQRHFQQYFSHTFVLCLSVLLVEETGVPGDTTDMSQVTDKLYHIMLSRVHLTKNCVRTYYFSEGMHGLHSLHGCKSNYHTTTTTSVIISCWTSSEMSLMFTRRTSLQSKLTKQKLSRQENMWHCPWDIDVLNTISEKEGTMGMKRTTSNY